MSRKKRDNLEKNMDSSRLQLNGPINVIRLEGEVEGIKKVVYLFMDSHKSIYNQSKCSNYYSEDIDKYLAKFMHENENSNVTYDLFIEDKPSYFYDDIVDNPAKNSSYINYKQIHIISVNQMFRNMFNYDIENQKVKQSDFTKNFRLHYMDIRDRLKYHYDNDVSSIYNYVTHLNQAHFHPDSLSNILSLLDGIEEKILKVINAEKSFKKIKTISIKKIEQFDEDSVKNFFYKIRCMYKNKNIKDILNREIDKTMDLYRSVIVEIKNIKEKIVDADNIFKMYGDYNSLKEEFKGSGNPFFLDVKIIPDLLRDLLRFTNILFENVMNINSTLTDIYALRRLLDKTYITNCIMYTGGYHSCNYVYILTHYFDFKITHVAYSYIKDIEQLNKKVKQVDFDDIKILLLNLTAQCSDITSFPKNFM